jgi:ABC-type uncharacterized transport system ATPase subunit
VNNMNNPDNREVVLEVEDIVKRFPGVLANDHVNLTLHRGEILALLGENGAGKSTLMNIIYGLYHHDEGSIRLKGREVHFTSPREAIHSGIGMVHQHFQLVPVMTVAENVILGEEQTASRKGMRKIPLEDTKLAGYFRLAWGLLWRIVGPFVAAFIGWLVAQIVILLIFVIATYIGPAGSLNTPIVVRATKALGGLYADHPTFVSLIWWLPVFIGSIVGAVVVWKGFWHARKTWRGTALATLHKSRVDGVIDAVIDLISTSASRFHSQRAATKVHEISQQFGLEVDPNAIVEKLPVGTQQRVEIVKALYRQADILILDEPTAVLTPQEGVELFKIMRELAAKGVSIIFITHKLKEVLTVADSIVVMRGGKVVGSAVPAEATEQSLAAMMVGREVILRVAKETAKPQDVVLSVADLHAQDDRGAISLDGVGFKVRAGEVLGIAGVQGNGQTELVEVLTGLRKPLTGEVYILGTEMTNADPRTITINGTAHVPEDRQRHGMVKPFSVADNLILNRYYVAPFSTTPSWRELPGAIVAYLIVFGLWALLAAQIWVSVLNPALRESLQLANLNAVKENGAFMTAMFVTLLYVVVVAVIGHFITSFVLSLLIRRLNIHSSKHEGGLSVNDMSVRNNARHLIKEFDIRTPSITTPGGNLSGGNQQKMIVAREFSRKPRLLIASQPTRGIDVGSIEFIHQQIVQQRDEGTAVLLVSAELDEIMALSDRIAVMYRGHIIDTVDAHIATREQLGLLMAGIKSESGQMRDAATA